MESELSEKDDPYDEETRRVKAIMFFIVALFLGTLEDCIRSY